MESDSLWTRTEFSVKTLNKWKEDPEEILETGDETRVYQFNPKVGVQPNQSSKN